MEECSWCGQQHSNGPVGCQPYAEAVAAERERCIQAIKAAFDGWGMAYLRLQDAITAIRKGE